MTVKSGKKTAGTFPPLCCGACDFSHPDADGDFECFVDHSIALPDGVGGMIYSARGVPVDPFDHICRDFKPRMHS